ncbi:MAG: TraB/GumN family protein, partial [Ruminococcus sp.]|nr:TraB/GumN family protein [Ruminococcus sp.]
LTEMEYEVDEDEYAKLTDEEKELYADYQKTMLTDRNVGMADKAEEYLASGKNVFVAVGAGHMVSDEGVVQLLKNRGCKVERVNL